MDELKEIKCEVFKMKNRKTSPGREKFSFLSGYNQVKLEDAANVKAEILKALKLKTRVSWYQRLYGNIEPKISEYQAIERIMKKYGVTKRIWGE